MAAARYITLLCLLQPYGHLACCGFNERLLINTAFIFFFLCHTRGCKLTYSAVCSLKEHLHPTHPHVEGKLGEGI